MTAWIDPRMMQLAALGTQDDPYLADGRHLRWFMNPTLGFPRTGFVLKRREALVWDPETLQGEGLLREQYVTEPEMASGNWLDQRVEFPNGLTVSRTFWPPSFGTIAGFEALELDPMPYLLDVGPPPPVPVFGAGRRDPAAYLTLFVLMRPKESAFVEASAYFDARGERGLVDRARVTTADGVNPTGDWVMAWVFLDGGLIERVEVTGEDAFLVSVQWVPARLYAESREWEEVDRFRLPLTDAAPIYPEWTPEPGFDVASKRLLMEPPKAFPPWKEEAYPPPPADPAEMEKDLTDRYLGNGAFDAVDQAMRSFLEGELSAVLPQSEISEVDEMTSDDNPGLPAKFQQHPQKMLLSAAADPHMARLLGLMTTDFDDPKTPYDYLLEAEFPSVWIGYAQSPAIAEAQLGVLRDTIGGMPEFDDEGFPVGDWQGVFSPQRVLSLATRVFAEPVPPPQAPAGFAGAAVAAPGHEPVPAETRLGWTASTATLFEDPSRHIFYALRRAAAGGAEEVLNRVDEDLGLPMPILPTRSAESNGTLPYADRRLPGWDIYTYRLSGMDLWGRFSPYATATVQVVDEVPPPAPTRVTAELAGDAEAAPDWDEVRITFDWTDALDLAADDLHRLHVHLRQGRVSPAAAGDPATWGRFEHQDGASDPPIEVPWPPAAGPLAAPAGLTARLTVAALGAGDGGGQRLTVIAGPVGRPFDDGFAHLSATVTAIDHEGNESPPAVPATATRVDPTPPTVTLLPAELEWGSSPDARMRSFYSLGVQAPAGGTVEVRRAAEIALLHAAGVDLDTWWDGEEADRICDLRQMAIAHPEVMTRDTELPLDDSVTEHRVELVGGDRGWTVLVAVPYSRTGIAAAWPTDPLAFAVVAVPRRRVLATPHLERVLPVDGAVELHVAADPEAVASRLRVYRTRSSANLGDVRRMRPVADVPVSGPQAVTIVDDTVHAYREYYYRVVAESDGGRRSEPSAPVAVRTWTTAPPAPAEIVDVTTVSPSPDRVVRFRLERDDYEAELLRRINGSVLWQEAGGGGVLDLNATTALGRGEYELIDPIPSELRRERFVYVMRVRDPSGRTTHSTAFVEPVPTLEERR